MTQLTVSKAKAEFVTLSDGQIIAAYPQVFHARAPWVVFSNSLATDHSIWSAQVEALAGRWNILRYDQRGHGASPEPSALSGFDRLGADVVELLDRLGVKRAAYVGLSMGVPTGLAAVAAAPDRFSGLLLADGQARTAPGGGQQWRERIAFVQEQGLAAFAPVTASRWLADPTGERLARLEAMIARTPLDGFVACAGALADFDFTAGLSQIDCPVLLVAGERDGKLPETMRAMADLIPGARFETIAEAGHVPCFERPDAFNASMLAFLETLT